MNIVFKITFLFQKYRATNWNSHINEGIVEWPPSPWRILRALVATFYRYRFDHKNKNILSQIVHKLSLVYPVYYLPHVEYGHTRHYVPVPEPKKQQFHRLTTRSLLIDAFIVFSDNHNSIWVKWSGLTLDQNEQSLLEQICTNIPYLGRSESLIVAELIVAEIETDINIPPMPVQAKPILSNLDNKALETVELLAPFTPEKLQEYHNNTEKAFEKDSVPETTLSLLKFDTHAIAEHKLTKVPGTHWVCYGLYKNEDYKRERISFSEPRINKLNNQPSFVRFQLVAPVLPSLTRAVVVGEAVRSTLIRLCGKIFGINNVSPLLSGHDIENEGKPMRGHRHCWYLPEDADGDGIIDHLIVYTPQGFDDKTLYCLQKLRQFKEYVWEDKPIQTCLVASESIQDYLKDVSPFDASQIIASASTWQTITPVVLTRHVKKNSNRVDSRTGLIIDSPKHQIVRLIEQLQKDKIIQFETPSNWDWDKHIEIQKDEYHNPTRCTIPLYAFKLTRSRGKGATAGTKYAYWVRITFPEPITGPLAIGYAAHFGLGTFYPL